MDQIMTSLLFTTNTIIVWLNCFTCRCSNDKLMLFAMLAVQNSLNCPLMMLTNDLVIVPSLSVENSISICHECGPMCTYKEHGDGKMCMIGRIICIHLTYIV